VLLRSRLLFVVLVCTLAGVVAVLVGQPGPRQVTGALTGQSQGVASGREGREADDSVRPGQTSEGIEGEIAEPLPPGVLVRPRILKDRTRQVAPGVRYRRWVQTDRRGRVRLHLLRADPAAPGVGIDYATGTLVPDRAPLTALLRSDDAVAGVNGGFFDISDTGAPLGVGVDPGRGFLHASYYTWNNAFYLTPRGEARIERLQVAASIAEYPQVEITNLNSPRVREAKTGIYTPQWGSTYGARITDGQTRDVRMVVIQDGMVVANRTSLTSGKRIDGTVLIGRGPSATQLALMRVGSTATVRWRLPGRQQMAISGERVLLRDGRRRVSDDRELHPRTAVGIDRRGRILLLVVDGRSRSSRGFTLVELARTLKQLGAVDALNLDGGGSTTMAADDPEGRLRVVNTPSDGSLRSIPDGIGITYARPRR
jgi:hypothetical protein